MLIVYSVLIACAAVAATSLPPTATAKKLRDPVDLYQTSGSAIAEGPRDVLVSRNSATTKYRYRVALFA